MILTMTSRFLSSIAAYVNKNSWYVFSLYRPCSCRSRSKRRIYALSLHFAYDLVHFTLFSINLPREERSEYTGDERIERADVLVELGLCRLEKLFLFFLFLSLPCHYARV